MTTKKVNRIAVGIWLLIAVVILGSNNVIEYLRNFGLDASSSALFISLFMILLAYYHMDIAKNIAGAI